MAPQVPNPVLPRLPPQVTTRLLAVALGGFQLIGSFGAAGNQPERKGMDLVAVVLVLTGPAALALRHRWPLVPVAASLAAAVTYVGLGYAYGPIFASVVVSIVGAVLADERRGTIVLVGSGLVAMGVATAVDPRGDGADAAGFALVTGWAVGVYAVAEVIRARRDALAERARAAEDEQRRRADEQRLALAQELHDVLAHHISLVNVQAGVALHLIDEQPERVRPALAAIKDASREALGQLRGALDVLRRGDDAPRAPAPRIADISQLVASVGASGLDVRLDLDGIASPLPAAVELAAYRIVQEALTNVTRHAGARSVEVRLALDEGELTVEIVDDGTGATGAEGVGITGMRRRAESLGGTLAASDVEGGAHHGFRVTARLPVDDRGGGA